MDLIDHFAVDRKLKDDAGETTLACDLEAKFVEAKKRLPLRQWSRTGELRLQHHSLFDLVVTCEQPLPKRRRQHLRRLGQKAQVAADVDRQDRHIDRREVPSGSQSRTIASQHDGQIDLAIGGVEKIRIRVAARTGRPGVHLTARPPE